MRIEAGRRRSRVHPCCPSSEKGKSIHFAVASFVAAVVVVVAVDVVVVGVSGGRKTDAS